MPELPEVETMVRGIRSALEGHVLVDVSLCTCRCQPILFQPDLTEVRERSGGRLLTSVGRRAKRIVMTLEDGSAFVIEPRMTGLMLLADPPDHEHLRVRWTVRRGRKRQAVWFWDRRGLGTVKLLDAAELEAELGPGRLGPDALEMTLQSWCGTLARTNRPIKVALLDQKLVAGIGNLYASEILHRAGIHPATPASRLSLRRVEALHAAVVEILSTAIEYEGSTLGDGTYRNVLNQDGSYQNQHRVYARAEEACPTCRRGRVRRVVQAQRSTFYCPRCQRR